MHIYSHVFITNRQPSEMSQAYTVLSCISYFSILQSTRMPLVYWLSALGKIKVLSSHKFVQLLLNVQHFLIKNVMSKPEYLWF